MGYTITIGQADIEWDCDRVTIIAQSRYNDRAPAFGEPTDYTNSRWPSYSGWGNFCRALGLMDLFFGNQTGTLGIYEFVDGVLDLGTSPDGIDPLIWESAMDQVRAKLPTIPTLMPEHPGTVPLLPTHLAYARSKVESYRLAHPNAIAKFPAEVDADPNHDGNLCRAEWLLYWMEWAINNCDKPIFYNS
jgi:hypothetical protein